MASTPLCVTSANPLGMDHRLGAGRVPILLLVLLG